MNRIVVVGAGVFGAWTAHHLLARGFGVTLVDAYGPANARSSSGDETRIIRCGYGADAIYTDWARRSLTMWQEWFAREAPGPLPLFHACGVLWLAAPDDAYAQATLRTVRSAGQPIEVLDAGSLRARFPRIAVEDGDVAMLEPASGVLLARRAVQSLVTSIERRGAVVVRGVVVAPAAPGRLRQLTLGDGRSLAADGYVFACGPWLPKVFPGLLAGRIRPTRQAVMYFGASQGDDGFSPPYLPAWVDFASGVYGVPDIETRGVKVGLDAHGPHFDPDTDPRVIDAASVERARAWLRRRLPALADAPLVDSRICQYENTSSGDFLIDRHPEFENVWIAGGGSGHGFKHGPMVGAYVASLVDGSGTREPRFLLSEKKTLSARVVF